MAEFKISRFRYTWRNEWAADSSTYNKDDIVLYQGKAWVCIRQHTASTFYQDQAYVPPGETLVSPAWIKMTDGQKYLGGWAPNQVYDAGVLVNIGANVYLCITSHTAGSNFSTTIANWEIFATGSKFRSAWTASTRFRVGDVVVYGGNTYQCILEHDSALTSVGIIAGNNNAVDDSTLETWTYVLENDSFIGNYTPGSRIRVNELVKYGGSILRCTQEHTAASGSGSIIDNTRFETYLQGHNFLGNHAAGGIYAIGDVVRYGGFIYRSRLNQQSGDPGFSDSYPQGNPNWEKIVEATNYAGVYDPVGSYKNGDVVQKGGSIWKCITDVEPDGSTLMYLDSSNWELVIPSDTFRGEWLSTTNYSLGDFVYYKGSTYKCIVAHIATLIDFPGDNGSVTGLWELLVQGSVESGLVVFGDLLTYNQSRLPADDQSSLGPTRIPIGSSDTLLTVTDNLGSIGWEPWGDFARVFYVRTNGVDDDTDVQRGTNYFKPYRTLRYALTKADDGYEGFTTVIVSTGEYYEVLPLIVPARTMISGDELRSVTIRASLPNPNLDGDAFYTLSAIQRLSSITTNLVTGSLITRSTGNTLTQSIFPTGNNATAILVQGLFANIIDTINYRVNELGVMPVTSGTNTLTVDSTRLQTVINLENNKDFLAQEAVSYIQQSYPEYDFNSDLCKRDVKEFIKAIQYDLRYPGNYKTLLAARYYSNAVTGSALEDMFYFRDTTGIKNATLKGLEGELPAEAEGVDYQIPTGGNFVSLDPGWGPNDSRTWITTRSPYIQNVTTFGIGAVGQKVDGALHNGGNRSIVSNDFTQVISDGIGAWISNGGRAELVSVFSYYAYIGMFASNGGIIRATNGNSSYGTFGAVADGIDDTEVVRYGKINTRTEQAIVAAAFAGEVNDFIFSVEFTNAGQEYTEASYILTSSGSGAVAVQEEFRDNSVFEIQTLSAGLGFIRAGNQAAGGNTTTITLATSESVIESEILGMRIILTSGVGTGQYGYVTDYNLATRVCTVYRESDDLPGWDHILPGTPSSPILTTGTTYRFEPRPIFSDPGFIATNVTLPAAGNYSNIVYGETSAVYTSITGSAGTGTVDGTDGQVPVTAVWTVSKNGRNYSVTLTNPGAGYRVNDIIVVSGASLGGLDIEHDLTIRVLSTTEDSTNSIVSYEIFGSAIADSGKFVIMPSSTDQGRYSGDGVTWGTFTLPAAGNWRSVATGKVLGTNTFVAVRYGTATAASSIDGVEWTTRSMPSSRNWNGVAYGKPSTASGVFVAVSGNLNSAAYSTNGTSWTSSTLPTYGDSTLNEWVDVTFGNNVFVAIANSNNIAAVGTWNGTTLTWQGTIMDAVADSSAKDWVSVAYGNRRFVAISSTGDVAYSFDGNDWIGATLPTQDGSTLHNWKQIKYGQGVFFAVGDTGSRTVGADPTTGPTTFAATSYDGVVWTPRTLATSAPWGSVAFGNPDISLGDSTVTNSRGMWITVVDGNGTANANINRIFTGARTLGRIVVEGRGVRAVRLWEPGSGYTVQPSLTIVDPNKTIDPIFRIRVADGVLAQPTFVTKGSAYKTSKTTVAVIGNGFADITPVGRYVTIDNLSLMPGPGAQFYIGGRSDFFTAVVVGIDQIELADGTFQSTFQLSPQPTLADFLEHDMEILIREKYSQVRITGHDFLDIGTGNIIETNYPVLYQDYEYTPQPLLEVQNFNGGRVFYTSTDQDGNFRAGELFAVQQSTGIITISAEFFDLQGLTELRLGGIRVGSTAVIREFSKDPLFLQNSNNIIPTQRAVVSYLSSRLNIGGEDLLTPAVTAGLIILGPNKIDNNAGFTIDVPVMVDFSGPNSRVSGSIVAQTMFFRSFRDD
jgi:hypothetical protein